MKTDGDSGGGRCDVLLVSMPFAFLFKPSIALSLLKASLKPLKVETRVAYFTLDFARIVGDEHYTTVAEGDPVGRPLLGEWIFAGELAPTGVPDSDYVDAFLDNGASLYRDLEPVSDEFLAGILDMKAKAGAFLDSCVDKVLARRPRIVGFTSTFQQHVASLALAKRLKAADPDLFIVIGGANCEGVMGAETIRQFPFIDAAVSGEGDLVFPELIRRLEDGKPPLEGLKGVYLRGTAEDLFETGHFGSAARIPDLDALPYPDYQDYFEQYGAVSEGFRLPLEPDVLFETSRGCWWGEKHHCTFCGLNGLGMAYRAKSGQRALEELDYLTSRYPDSVIQVVDNILDLRYFKDFLPGLVERGNGVDLVYETKANLSRDQLKLMRRAGITAIQPGIESLADPVLRIMRKGVTAMQNIQLLKWCKELGVFPAWNLLWGFPGEPPEAYRAMADMLPWLSHLQPPLSAKPMRLDRFSPNFDHAESMGLTDVRPNAAYEHIYALPGETVANLAYYFDYEYADPQDVYGYTAPLLEAVRVWRDVHRESDLFFDAKDDELSIWDLRPVAGKSLTVLKGTDMRVFLVCQRAHGLRRLRDLIAERWGQRLSGEEIAARLAPLVRDGLVVQDGDRYLSPAIPLGTYSPRKDIMAHFCAVNLTPFIGTERAPPKDQPAQIEG